MLDLFNNQVVSVDVDRDHGFLEGMGIPVGRPQHQRQGADERALHRRQGRQLQDRLPAAHPGRDPGRQVRDGELPAEGPEHQPRLRDQRARRRGRRRGAQGRRTARRSSSRSTAAARTSRSVSNGSIAATAGQFPGKMAVSAWMRSTSWPPSTFKPGGVTRPRVLQHRHQALHQRPAARRARASPSTAGQVASAGASCPVTDLGTPPLPPRVAAAAAADRRPLRRPRHAKP